MKINALVLGKSGVGKSTLLNYLWGSEIRDAGVGRPVTTMEEKEEIGIFALPPLKVEGHEIIVHDSYGLEADKAERWIGVMKEQMAKREETDEPEDWFHAVIYCLDAKKSRLDPFEIQHVIKPILEAGHPVTVVFTKADIASNEELIALEKVVRDRIGKDVDIIEIGSESKTLRSGKVIEPFGKDHLIESLADGFVKGVTYKWKARHRTRFLYHCAQWKARTLAAYDEEASFFRRTATTLDKVKDKSDVYIYLELKAFETWSKAARDRLDLISEAFNKVLDVDVRKGTGAYGLARSTKIPWDFSEHAAEIVMCLIPLMNLAYSVARTSMHRDLLEAKLDEAILEMTRSFEEQLERRQVIGRPGDQGAMAHPHAS